MFSEFGQQEAGDSVQRSQPAERAVPVGSMGIIPCGARDLRMFLSLCLALGCNGIGLIFCKRDLFFFFPVTLYVPAMSKAEVQSCLPPWSVHREDDPILTQLKVKGRCMSRLVGIWYVRCVHMYVYLKRTNSGTAVLIL